MCGLGGGWETPDSWPDAVTGCVPTPMCSNIPDDSAIPEASGLKPKT